MNRWAAYLLHEEVSGNAEEARKIIALWLSSAV
jgi:hypothetical protein